MILQSQFDDLIDEVKGLRKTMIEGSLVDSISLEDTRIVGGETLSPVIDCYYKSTLMQNVVEVRVTSQGIALVTFSDSSRAVFRSDWSLFVGWVKK